MNRSFHVKSGRRGRFFPLVAALLVALGPLGAAPDFDSVVIREVPGYSGNYVRMTVGLNGNVLLACGQNKSNGILWVLDKEGRTVGVSEGMGNNLVGAAGDREGRVALAAQHVVHSVIFYDPGCEEVAKAEDYTQDMGGGAVGFHNPAGVWVGKSGKFYGYDLYGKNVRVYSPEGTEEKRIPLRTDQPASALNGSLFVDEERGLLFVVTKASITEFTLDGEETNRAAVTLTGPVTMNEKGQLYHYDTKQGELQEINSAGEVLSTVSLLLVAEEGDVDHPWWWSVAVYGDEIFLRKGHPTVLFQRFKLSDGSPVRVVEAAHEKVGAPAN